MATTRRDRNRNFFKWKPEDAGSSRFTPNAPINWFYEITEVEESQGSYEDDTADEGAATIYEDIKAGQRLAEMTPTNAELLRAAEMSPPPPEWFEEDEEPPF
jgi:hypothetical protein